MPKAPATFSQEDEDEKTTIESGWEEEASTTVEQGEVAEKIRSLAVETPIRNAGTNGASARNNTNITSTSGSGIEEPTVDDQRAHAALSVLTPSVAPARIVVTAGNDKGQELEIRPGKIYTIGRAIDNDFVLTDIAVSRKHFDLRFESGTWVVVDRGSGNGTVINGTIEDQPFVLMNGDAIEIGNTSFRFDYANQPARVARNTGFTIDLDEEPSTVAGKPLRDDPATPAQLLPPPRPKTVPPPAPRTGPKSSSPPIGPVGYAGINGARGSISAAPPGPTNPHLPSMGGPLGVPMASPTAPTVSPLANMPAMARPMGPPSIGMHQAPHQAPTMLGENGVIRPQMLHQHSAHDGMAPLQNVMPTTIPGQGPPVPPSQPQVPAFSYPNVNEMHPHLGQLQINGGIPRDATATAHVQPVPYGSMGAPAPMMPYSMVAQPQRPVLSRRVKFLLGACALMLFAAIATIAIIKSGNETSKPKAGSGQTKDNKSVATTDKKPEVKVTEIKKTEDTTSTKPDDPKVAEAKKAEEAKQAEIARAEAAKAEAAKKAEIARAEEAKQAEEAKKAEIARAEEAKKSEVAKRAEEAKKAEEAKAAAEAKKVADAKRAEEAKKDEEAKRIALADKRAAAAKRAEEAAAKRQAALDAKRNKTNKGTKTTVASTTPTPTTTTTKKDRPPADLSEVKTKADNLYRNKKFADAASLLKNAANGLGEADARELRSAAASYEQFARAYNFGMGPATPPEKAYDSLQTALNLDRSTGAFTEEIKAKLGPIAVRAAAVFMGNKKFESAFQAVRVAEGNGAGNGTSNSIRQALVDKANEIYQAAQAEKDTDPDAAKQKYRQIIAITDAKSPVYGKAKKALGN